MNHQGLVSNKFAIPVYNVIIEVNPATRILRKLRQ